MSSPERVDVTREQRGEKKEGLGTGWKVLAGVEAVALAVGREYFGMGQRRGEAAENRSAGEFLGDVVKTSAEHLKGVGKLLEVVEVADESDRLRGLKRAVEDATDETTRTEAEAALQQEMITITRAREDRRAMQENMAQMWEALMGPGKNESAA